VTVDQSKVFLEDRSTGRLVRATLFDAILDRHLDDVEQLWEGFPVVGPQEHGHWDWRGKTTHYAGSLSHDAFALECNGQAQGLMIVSTIKRCRLQQQSSQHLVYIEYLQTAPWNRRVVARRPSYRGVGTVLVAAAIQRSVEEGYGGRIGLHSLPQANRFYGDKCGMTDLGPDAEYPNAPLRYFEMTEQQAQAFMGEGR